MRLLKRNLTTFEYRAYAGKTEKLNNGMHTGEWEATYAAPVTYEGQINAPLGYAENQYFGVETRYSHILLMDDPDVDINENGLIDWKGDTYEIRTVRSSLNVFYAALQRRNRNNAPTAAAAGTEGGEQAGTEPGTEAGDGT